MKPLEFIRGICRNCKTKKLILVLNNLCTDCAWEAWEETNKRIREESQEQGGGMANVRMIFNAEDVIWYFMEEDFKKIPTNRLTNYIINIHPKEEEMLSNWELHFQGRAFPGYQLIWKSPYAITKTIKTLNGRPTEVKELWKESVVKP